MRDRLQCGSAIEFEANGEERRAVVSTVLPPGQADQCTHELECLQTGQDLRVRLNEDSCMLSCSDLGIVDEYYNFCGMHMPALPAHIEHSCTDICGLFFLLATLCILAWIGKQAIQNGSLLRLHTSTDYEGNMCGRSPGVEDKLFSYWCMHSNESSVNLKYPICVDECPQSNASSHVCYSEKLGFAALIPDYPSKNLGLSPYCWPKDYVLREQVKEERSQEIGGVFRGILLIPDNAWLVFPVTCVSASIMGYLYFKMLEKCVDFVILVFVLAATNLSVICGLLAFYTAYSGTDARGWVVGAGLLLFGCIAIHVLSKSDTQAAIGKAAGCIEAACECINQEVSLLMEPIVSLIVRVTILLYLFAILLLTVTCGDMERLHKYEVRKHLVFSAEESASLGFILFVTFWFMEMSTSMSQYVLAWVSERWYFTPYVNDQKLDWERHAVFKGYFNAIRYHMGSIAFGSFLILTLRPLRIMLFIFDTLQAKLCPGHQQTHFRLVRHINKDAYLMLAMCSDTFLRSAKSAEYMRNNSEGFESISMLNGLQGIFQFGGLLAISLASGLGTLLLFQLFPVFGPDSKVRDNVIWIAIACSVPIGIGYMTLFDTVGDTILYCWAVQQSRYHYRISHERPKSVTGWKGATFLPGFLGDYQGETFEKVNYAPEALRELVLGRTRRGITFPC